MNQWLDGCGTQWLCNHVCLLRLLLLLLGAASAPAQHLRLCRHRVCFPAIAADRHRRRRCSRRLIPQPPLPPPIVTNK